MEQSPKDERLSLERAHEEANMMRATAERYHQALLGEFMSPEQYKEAEATLQELLEDAGKPENQRRQWGKEIPVKLMFLIGGAPMTVSKLIAALLKTHASPMGQAEQKTVIENFRKEMEPLAKMWKTAGMSEPVIALDDIKERAKKFEKEE